MINSFMQLVPRYLLYNKKRTLAIAFSIIFSSMLLTSVGIIINSYNEMAINAMGEMFGKYHGEYINIEFDNLGKSSKIPQINTIGTSLKLGEHKSDKYSLQIIGADANALDMLNCKLIEGNYPQKMNEIVLEQWVINKLEQKLSIGDKINLDYEMINTKGFSLGTQNSDFIICGIIENNYGTASANKGKAYVTLQTAEQYIEKYDRAYRQYFAVNTSANIRQELTKVKELLSIRNADENIFGDYNENYSYVDAIEKAYKSRKLIFFIDVIVALVAVMVVFNVFNISVIERLKHFGLLRAIGAAPKQIKYMLLAESLFLGIIFIPLGIIIGVFATHLLLLLTSRVGYFDVSVKVNVFNIALPLVMGFLSVFIAVYNSAKLGAKVSPVEAMNSENKIMKKQANMKSLGNKLILSVYGQMGKMALINIGRHKKRFIATVMTISISIALFISVFYLITCLDPVYQTSRRLKADYVLTYEANKEKKGYPVEAIRQLDNIQGIKKINKMKQMYCNILLDTKYLTKEGLEYFKKEAKSDDYVKELLDRNTVDLTCYAIGLNEEMYNEYFKDKEEAKSLKGQMNDLPDAFIIQNLNHGNYINLNSEDVISIVLPYKDNDKWNKIEKEFIIRDTIDNEPFTINVGNAIIAVFMKEELLQKYYLMDGYQRIEIYLDNDANVKEIEEQLKEIALSQKYGKLVSFQEDVEKMRRLQTQLALVLYSMVVVISLVGLLNIINTMSMNILLRKREFGILRAMGVTKSQLTEMILKEGLLYGVVSSLLGSTIGIALIYLLYHSAGRALNMELWIDYYNNLIVALFIIILCVSAALIPLRRITSTSVVEAISAIE